jgi:hypothetical protein
MWRLRLENNVTKIVRICMQGTRNRPIVLSNSNDSSNAKRPERPVKRARPDSRRARPVAPVQSAPPVSLINLSSHVDILKRLKDPGKHVASGRRRTATMWQGFNAAQVWYGMVWCPSYPLDRNRCDQVVAAGSGAG